MESHSDLVWISESMVSPKTDQTEHKTEQKNTILASDEHCGFREESQVNGHERQHSGDDARSARGTCGRPAR